MTKKEQQKLLDAFLKAIEPRVAKMRDKIIHTYAMDVLGKSPFAIKISPVLGVGMNLEFKSCHVDRLCPNEGVPFSEGAMYIHLKWLTGARSQVLQKLLKEFDEVEKWFYTSYAAWEQINKKEGDALDVKNETL